MFNYADAALSPGQIEVRKIINSFLGEYESIQNTDPEYTEKRRHLYGRVLEVFRSNEVIRNDAVTSQRLGTSQYAEDYLMWLIETGEVEIRQNFYNYPTVMKFSMHEIVYQSDGALNPAYEGGVKYDSTVSCLFGLAQGKSLNPIISGEWISIYFDAIDLWRVGSGGHHRLLAHVLCGSDRINPSELKIVRNEPVDSALNAALLQFEELSAAVAGDHRCDNILAFNATSISQVELRKIKAFFNNINEAEKAVVVRCLKAIKKYKREELLNHASVPNRKITIDAMYRLLEKIRTLRAKPFWHRRALVLRQKLLGLRTVDPITCSILQLATHENPYWDNSSLNERGLLCCFSGLRNTVLKRIPTSF